MICSADLAPSHRGRLASASLGDDGVARVEDVEPTNLSRVELLPAVDGTPVDDESVPARQSEAAGDHSASALEVAAGRQFRALTASVAARMVASPGCRWGRGRKMEREQSAESEGAARRGRRVVKTRSAPPVVGSDGKESVGHQVGAAGRCAIFLGALLVLAGLYLASLYNYLLFHSLAELFSIVVACSIFVIVWNTRRLLDNSYLLFVGIAYLFIGALDLLHTLAYTGMNVFPGRQTNLPGQLWIGARYAESLSLLLAGFFIGRRLKLHLLLLGYCAVFVAVVLSIFWWDVFPICFVEKSGLTAFKKISEYVICLILVASIAQLLRNRARFDRGVLRLLIASIAVTIASEFSFTLYVHAYGLPNLIGHYLKLVSFYLIYKALIQTGLVRPYSLLFRELKQTVAQLERSNAELEQFAHVASHDLQAPLAVITDYVRLLQRAYKGKLDGRADTFIAGAVEGVGRMQELIRDTLAYSRVETRGRPFERVACSDAVDQALTNLRVTIKESGGVVAYDPLPSVMADGPQLVQLFQNLIDNALKFRRDEPPEVRIGAEQKDGDWLFFVRDNGIGIPPEAAERIFAMFGRVHGKSEYPGTGIGLAICRKIVDRHGGRIWVESEPGKGATFYFTIPATEA